MATGKTAGKYTSILIDGYDVSGDSASVNLKVDGKRMDATALASGTMENLYGIPQISATGNMWFSNAANSGSYTLLKAQQARVVAVSFGIRAVVAPGDPCMAGQWMCQLNSYPIAMTEASKAVLDIDGTDPTIADAIAVPFGVVLHENKQETATANGTTIDNLASSANGARGVLMVTAAGGTWAITIQHDTASNMATATTLMTFSSNGTAITGEVKTVSGTVNRYVRAVMTRTSGNFNGYVALCRG